MVYMLLDIFLYFMMRRNLKNMKIEPYAALCMKERGYNATYRNTSIILNIVQEMCSFIWNVACIKL